MKTQPARATHVAFPCVLPSQARRTGQTPGTGHRGTPGKDTHAVGTGAGPGLGGRPAPSSGPRLALSSNLARQNGCEQKPNMSNVAPGEIPGMEPKKQRSRTSFLDPSAPAELAGWVSKKRTKLLTKTAGPGHSLPG